MGTHPKKWDLFGGEHAGGGFSPPGHGTCQGWVPTGLSTKGVPMEGVNIQGDGYSPTVHATLAIGCQYEKRGSSSEQV